jgi:ankyrin repeat protein
MKLNSTTVLQRLVIFAFFFCHISNASVAQQEKSTPTEKLLKLTENLKISDYDEIEKLIELGAEVNSINSQGVSPLYCAFEFENDAYHNEEYIFSQKNAYVYKVYIDNLKELLKEFDTILKKNYGYVLTLAVNGASAQYKTGRKNATIEINGKYYTEKEQIQELLDEIQSYPLGPIKAKKIVDLLIEEGAEIDFPNENGLTILQSAIYRKDYELCKLITPYKPNVNLNNKDGVSLLQKSIENNDYSSCNLLLQNGADIGIVNDKIQLAFVSKELKSVLKKYGATFKMKKAK